MPLKPSSFLDGHTLIITSMARFKFSGHRLLRILHQKNGPFLPLASGNILYVQKQTAPSFFPLLGPSFTATGPTCLYVDNPDASLCFIRTDPRQPPFLQTAAPWTPLEDSTRASWNKDWGPLERKSQDLRYLWFWGVAVVVFWALVWSWCSLGPT